MFNMFTMLSIFNGSEQIVFVYKCDRFFFPFRHNIDGHVVFVGVLLLFFLYFLKAEPRNDGLKIINKHACRNKKRL